MRQLVIGTDGTWNKPDQLDRGRQVPSNVVKIVRAVDEHARDVQQLKYYDTGVGTGGFVDKWIGGTVGHGLFRNVVEAYKWLIGVHTEGDRLFLFGFSRGAYTVRSLAGLLNLCGIPRNTPDLSSGAQALADEATKIYRLHDRARREDAAIRFREKYKSKPGSVHFLGVWDTVGALGLPTHGLVGWWSRRRQGFHDVSLGGNITHAFHALAIHERRKPFLPTLWRGEKPDGVARVSQCWFPGVHTNVGGGYADAGLSDRALLWMIKRAEEAGLRFNLLYLEKRIDPNWFGELRDSMTLKYRPLGPVDRKIEGDALGECIHFSAIRRWRSPSRPDPMPQAVETALRAGVPVYEDETGSEEHFHRRPIPGAPRPESNSTGSSGS